VTAKPSQERSGFANKPVAKHRFGTKWNTRANQVVRGGHSYIYVDTKRPELLSLRLSDFKEVWRRPCEHLHWLRAGTDVLLADAIHTIVAMAWDGSEIWRRRSGLYWRAWQNRVVVPGNPLEIVDQASGEVCDSIALPLTSDVLSLSGDIALVFDRDGTTAACDLGRKTLLWERNLRPVLEEVPAVDDRASASGYAGANVALFAFRRHVFAFATATGELLWRRPMRMWDPPTITADRIYAVHRQEFHQPYKLICLKPETGDVLFERDLSEYGEDYRRVLSTLAPIVHEDLLLLATSGAVIAAFSAVNGALIWHHHLDQGFMDPQIVDDKVIVTTGHGYLLVFDLIPKRKAARPRLADPSATGANVTDR
jgi:outer membrane protein assembly factor BamB